MRMYKLFSRKINMKRSGIAIIGSYGTQNIGDNAILTVIIKLVKKYMPGESITVIGPNPNRIFFEHNVHAFSSMRTQDIKQKIKLFKKSRLLIVGGGGLLQDNRKSSWISGMISNYVSQALFARLFGCRIAVLGVSIGPLSLKSSRSLVSILCKVSDYIITRDEESMKQALLLGSNSEKTTWVPDLTFCLELPTLQEKKIYANKYIINRKRYCVLNLRPLYSINKTNRPFEIPEASLQSLTKFLRWIMDTVGLEIIFIPFDLKYDLPVGRYLETIINNSNKFRLIREKISIQKSIDLMASAEITIGMRLHSLIFSYLAGTPLIPLVYDLKVGNFARQIEVAETINPDTMDYEAIKNCLLKVINKRANENQYNKIKMAQNKIHLVFKQLAVQLRT